MPPLFDTGVNVMHKTLWSAYLQRSMAVDMYVSKRWNDEEAIHLLLLNDGQDLPAIHFESMLNGLVSANQIEPLVCVGIYASESRLHDYGTAGILDCEGRGVSAKEYQQFVSLELIPFIHIYTGIEKFTSTGIAGFSMGALSAFDTAWRSHFTFNKVGVFSGSLWWRSKRYEDGYNDDKDKIVHRLVRNHPYRQGLQFYFTTGSLDEVADRNNNGVIDSIDDTLDLIKELEKKGYALEKDIRYINYEDGRHHIESWAKALPQFLLWGWSKH